MPNTLLYEFWTSLVDALPPEGEPFLGFHKDWICEDFNPKGIRECHRYGDGTEYQSCKWDDYIDEWTTTKEAPSHWINYPNAPI